MKNKCTKQLYHQLNPLYITLRWVVFSLITGTIVGLISCMFSVTLSFVTRIRIQHPAIITLLPFAGILIVILYHVLKDDDDTGTNLVISAIHSGDKIPLRMAPLIFISTSITHLFGGSVGREGAALQLGGSIGNAIGNFFKFDERDKQVLIMCGMSAAFSTLFGTPMAAAIFPMELVRVGIMYYIALVPCVVSSLTAHGIGTLLGISGDVFPITQIPEFQIIPAVQVSTIAIIAAFLSIFFCIVLHKAEAFAKEKFSNPYIRILLGGTLLVILTFLVGCHDYNGTGMHIIEKCVSEGLVKPEAFLLKILFTAITLSAGYKGGEIVPTLFIGATFGCFFGPLIGLNASLSAGIGMTALFCGVTNCPITALLLAFEFFGYDGMPYFLLTIAFSYILSGYTGLYHSQKIIYSKYKNDFVDQQTH